MYNFRQLRSSFSIVFIRSISDGLVSLVVYARPFVLEAPGRIPREPRYLFNFVFNFFLFFFLNFSYNYRCICGFLALFSFFVNKYGKKHNVTNVISTTCLSEVSKITSSYNNILLSIEIIKE